MFGLRVRRNSRAKWRRGKEFARRGNRWVVLRTQWPTMEAATAALERYRKRGWQGHPFEIELPLRLRALAEAKKLDGIREQGGNNQGAAVMAIIRATGGTGPEPWCGDAMAFCYRKAGSKVVSRSWAAVRFLGWLTGQVVVRVRRMLPGMLVVFTFDHVGMLIRYCDAEGSEMPEATATHVLTAEGNTGASGAISDSAGGGDGFYYGKIREIALVKHGVEVLR